MSRQSPDCEPGPYEQILLFGDSITQGAARNRWAKQGDSLGEMSATGDDKNYGFCFTAALQNVFTRRFDVIIRGFNGYNTEQASFVFPKILPTKEQAKLRLLIIFFGANDSMLPAREDSQSVDLEQYRRNLEHFAGHERLEEHETHILLITPPPVVEDRLPETGRGSRTAANTKRYVDACKEVAKNDVEVIDLWKAMMDEINWKEDQGPFPGSSGHSLNDDLAKHFTDGLHLNGNGYMVLFTAIMVKIEEKWPDMGVKILKEPMYVQDYRKEGVEPKLEDDVKVDRKHWKFPFWNEKKSWAKIQQTRNS